MDENKRLLDEIDKLDDEHETRKEESTDYKVVGENPIKSNSSSSLIIIIILFIVIVVSITYKIINSENSFDDPMDDEYIFDDEEYDSKVSLGDIIDLYNKEDDSEEIDQEIADEKQYKEVFYADREKITLVNSFKDINNDLIIEIKNDSQNAIENTDVYAVFYNSENKIVDIDYNCFALLESGKELYIYFSSTPEEYERFEICYSKSYYDENYLVPHTSDIEVSKKVTGQVGEIVFKNNSKVPVDYAVATILYLDESDKIIGIEYVQTSDLNVQNTEEYFGFFDETTYDYDVNAKCKIFVSEACSE